MARLLGVHPIGVRCAALPAPRTLAPGVAAERVLGRNLHEDQRDAVGVDDVHLMQPPQLLTGLAGDRHAAS